MVVGYEPREDGGEERDRFWNDMENTLDSVRNVNRLCFLGGDRIRAVITRAFGVSGENDNGRRVVEFFAERGLCIGNIYFKHKNLHKYKRVPRG